MPIRELVDGAVWRWCTAPRWASWGWRRWSPSSSFWKGTTTAPRKVHKVASCRLTRMCRTAPPSCASYWTCCRSLCAAFPMSLNGAGSCPDRPVTAGWPSSRAAVLRTTRMFHLLSSWLVDIVCAVDSRVEDLCIRRHSQHHCRTFPRYKASRDSQPERGSPQSKWLNRTTLSLLPNRHFPNRRFPNRLLRKLKLISIESSY